MATKGGSENIKTPEDQNADRRRIKDARRKRQTKGSKTVRPMGSDLSSQIEQDNLKAKGLWLLDNLTPAMCSSSPLHAAQLRGALIAFVDAYASAKWPTLRDDHKLSGVPNWRRRDEHALNAGLSKLDRGAIQTYFTKAVKAALYSLRDQEVELISA